MILAIEGPDLCGKTTLFNALKHVLPRAKFVSVPVFKELMPYMHLVDKRHLAMWDAVYDPRSLYVCDRSVFVSGQVYDRLYSRLLQDLSGWHCQVRVAYIDVPLVELQRRYAEAPDRLFDAANYQRALDLYEEVLPQFAVLRLRWPHLSLGTTVKRVVEWVT